MRGFGVDNRQRLHDFMPRGRWQCECGGTIDSRSVYWHSRWKNPSRTRVIELRSLWWNRDKHPSPVLQLACPEGAEPIHEHGRRWPHFLLGRLLFEHPVLLVLYSMLVTNRKYRKPFNIVGDLMEWLTSPKRIPFYIGIRIRIA